MTTGVGVRERVSVAAGEMDAYDRRLLRDHRMAAGPDAPREVVRAACCGSRTASPGTSGVRTELLVRVVDALNANETPRVRGLAPQARAISARWPTSPTASAATCPSRPEGTR